MHYLVVLLWFSLCGTVRDRVRVGVGVRERPKTELVYVSRLSAKGRGVSSTWLCPLRKHKNINFKFITLNFLIMEYK